MKRPHIPLAVRCLVAERQLRARGGQYGDLVTIRPLSLRLEVALKRLFDGESSRLDHLPALALRKFSKRTGMFSPDANDPDYLVYRSAHGHHIKTNVRGDGAQYPDRVLIKRWRRKAKLGKAGLGTARRGKARRGTARRGEAWRGTAGRGRAGRGEAGLGEAGQGKARQGKARRYRWPKRKLRSRSTFERRP